MTNPSISNDLPAAIPSPAQSPAQNDAARVAAEQAWRERAQRFGLDILAAHASEQPLALRPQHFFFMRHGETAGNHERILQHPEIELNDTGVRQVEEAASILAGKGIARIVASDVQRAWQSAEIVARTLGVEAHPSSGLRERFFGDLIGSSSIGLHWGRDPANGERLVDFVTRVRAGLQAAVDHTATTLIVAHGGTLYVIAHALGASLREDLIRNATPLLFERINDRWQLNPVAEVLTTGRAASLGW